MSHYSKYKTKFMDRDCLVSALVATDWTIAQIECHNTAKPLMGFEGRQRPETANVIIRKQFVGVAANDIGFAKDKSGAYQAIISDYDRRRKYDAAWMGTLQQHYNRLVSIKKARSMGYVVKEAKLEDGAIRLTLRR